jgi:hypothetical protein
MDKLVEKIPVETFLERSLDGKSAAIVFKAQDGSEYVLKSENYDGYKNLAVQEL